MPVLPKPCLAVLLTLVAIRCSLPHT